MSDASAVKHLNLRELQIKVTDLPDWDSHAFKEIVADIPALDDFLRAYHGLPRKRFMRY